MPVSLEGVGVLVTRPQDQADSLCEQIEAVGGRAIRFPTLAIVPPTDTLAVARMGQRLHDYDIAIFVSVNAVKGAEQLLGKETLRADLTAIKVMAIGAATAAALQLLDIEVAVTPERRYDSESLLDSKALQDVAGKRLVIFRGEGGRTLLADTLRQRGAQIDYAEVYRRIQPRTDVQPLLDAWQAEKIQVVTVTSNEALQNLYNMLNDEGRQKLLATPLVVMSQRTAELAQHLGFKHTPLVSAQASVTGLVAALLKWKQHKQA